MHKQIHIVVRIQKMLRWRNQVAASDLKSLIFGCVGSSPTRSTTVIQYLGDSYNGITVALQAIHKSSTLLSSTIIWKFSSAVEQRPYKAKVKGSIPLTSTKAPVTELVYVSVLEAEF